VSVRRPCTNSSRLLARHRSPSWRQASRPRHCRRYSIPHCHDYRHHMAGDARRAADQYQPLRGQSVFGGLDILFDGRRLSHAGCMRLCPIAQQGICLPLACSRHWAHSTNSGSSIISSFLAKAKDRLVDMNGLGHYLGPTLWFVAYWGLISAALFLLADLIRDRVSTRLCSTALRTVQIAPPP